MLYLVSGTNFVKRREKLASLIEYVLSKKPGSTVKRVSPSRGEKTVALLEELTLSQGLFEHRIIAVLEDFMTDEETRESIFSFLKQLQASDNIFIIYEGSLPDRVSKKISSVAEKVQEFKGEKSPSGKAFNIFNLADALGRRDKKGAWVELLKAFSEGSLPEEVHGTLFWQVKSMLMVKEGGGNAEMLGMKPFTYSKAKNFAKNYSLEELQDFSRSLVTLYHDSHRGLDSLELGLERLLLRTI